MADETFNEVQQLQHLYATVDASDVRNFFVDDSVDCDDELIDEGQGQPNLEPDGTFQDAMSSSLCSFSHFIDEEYVSFSDIPLFEGSDFKARDVCRFLHHLKSSNACIGDRLLASMLGMISVFLPRNNVVQQLLKSRPSMYRSLQVSHIIANYCYILLYVLLLIMAIYCYFLRWSTMWRRLGTT